MSEEKEHITELDKNVTVEAEEKAVSVEMTKVDSDDSEKSKETVVGPEITKATEKSASGGALFMNEAFDWLESVLMAIIAIVVIFTFFVRINTVSGTSMVPTLEEGEKLIVSGMFYTPEHNDIVIIQAKNLVNENGELGKPIVKRIIGLPGDTLHFDFDAGVVYRNGEALEIEKDDFGNLIEDGHFINTPTTLNWDINGDVVVPENYYFVMGDNRNGSKDSRDNEVGLIERNYIVGKAFFSIFPFDTFGSLY